MSRNDGYALSEVTFLNVPFREKDEAKALGARWNPERRLWYVPAGLEVAPFQRWLPATAQAQSMSSQTAHAQAQTPSLLNETAPDYEVSAERSGLRLSQLLEGVSRTINQVFHEGVWTEVEVVNAQLRGDHVFLELSERDAQANVIAQARAVIWGNVARTLLPRFERETGMQLAPGIKLLVRARPSFHAQYGFSLFINDIDFRFSLGDLEAKKREIIKRLKQEGLLTANQDLPQPWDYYRVLVVSPQQAAGLGDFQADAQRLQAFGLCEFIYVHARFQGEGAAQEIRQALVNALNTHQADSFDAVVIIRGGGAVNDLAWLNDYDLARTICELSIPVHTGIGHERDHTVLDDVAQQAFDTPSKVIGGIWQVIRQRAAEVQDNYTQVQRGVQQYLYRYSRRVEHNFSAIRADANQALMQAREEVQRQIDSTRQQAHEQLRTMRGQIPALLTQVHSSAYAQLERARHSSHSLLENTMLSSGFIVRRSREHIEEHLQHIQREAQRAVRLTQSEITACLQYVHHESQRYLSTARHNAEALFREIAGQGPTKTLERGFALIRDEQGQIMTDPATAQLGQSIRVEFKKGLLDAQVTQIKQTTSDDQNKQDS